MHARSRKILAAVAVSTGLLAPVVITAGAAQAAYNVGCAGYFEVFTPRIQAGYIQPRVHGVLGTTGRLIDDSRSGYNDRLRDTVRQYRSCGYRADRIVLNFDDYTSPGDRRYGGRLRLYGGSWDHSCVKLEELYDEGGNNYGFYCHDTNWEGEYYYDQAEGDFTPRTGHKAGLAAKVAKIGPGRVITREFSPRLAK